MMEIWQARSFAQVLSVGRNRPLVLECELPTAVDSGQEVVSQLMVVKSAGGEMTIAGLFCEFFGNLLAREMGILTPEPALVNISPQFVEAVGPLVNARGATLHPGLAAGCEFIKPGLASVVPRGALTTAEREQAACLYAFDMMVQNPDRRAQKPNCAWHHNRLMAFGF